MEEGAEDGDGGEEGGEGDDDGEEDPEGGEEGAGWEFSASAISHFLLEQSSPNHWSASQKHFRLRKTPFGCEQLRGQNEDEEENNEQSSP